MSNEVRKDDVAVQFVLTIQEDSVAVDVSGATTKEITIQKPSGTSTDYTASFFTDGTEGKIYYTSVLGDLDESGLYKIQGKVILSGGTYRTNIKKFKVRDNI